MNPRNIGIASLILIYKILKSVSINIGMMILGFAIGVGSIVFHYQYVALRNSNHEYLPKIEEKLDDLKRMDDSYTEKQKEFRELLKEMKIKLMVEESNLKIK